MTSSRPATSLARTLGLFDVTMLVMGGIVGAGIFMNPAVVAQVVHSPVLILGAWLAGGVVALLGAFIYAELAARRPEVGGQYAYIREAFHPLVAFLYGWTLLLVTQSGGMAAVAVTFARYAKVLTGWQVGDGVIAATALAALTAINCLGVRQGSFVQSVLMVLKIGAIAALVFCGAMFAPIAGPTAAGTPPLDSLTAFGAAMVPVLFAYGGWQTASFVSGEIKNPTRTLPRALLFGVSGVIVLYVAVSGVCLRVLGAQGLAATATPASDVMRAAFGEAGATLIAGGIAISTLGFLSQGILTAPRVYFAMARDGLFFRAVATVHPKTQVPVVAIALQGLLATIIALSGRYEQILNYVVSVDFIFFGLTAVSLLVLRRRAGRAGAAAPAFRAPWHPWTTLAFVAAAWLVVASAVARYPSNTVIGLGILLAGVPVYYLWRRRPEVA